MAVAPPKAEAVAQATVPPPKGPGDAAKEQGNAHFKAKEYLKASYTKAIKAEPENHVFFSNRSQAFLKLSKVTKALEDADKCIALAPTFVKGYHRKASALHALGEAPRTEEAVVVLLNALGAGVDPNDLVRLGVQIKGKSFVAQADAARKAGGHMPEEPPPPAPAPAPAPAKAPAPEAAALPAAAPGRHLWDLKPDEFSVEMIKASLEQLTEGGLEALQPCCYIQPPRPKGRASEEPPLGQVRIEHAFSSPENLLQCADFLRKQVSQMGAQAAVVVTLKSKVGYPQVWKNKKKGVWKYGDSDGIFLQLEAPSGLRQMYFTELKTKDDGELCGVGDTALLEISDFELFPRLFQ